MKMVKRRHYRRIYRRVRRGASKMTIPVAPIAGIAGALSPAINAALQGKFAGPDSALSWATTRLTGYNDQTGQWSYQEMLNGWKPIVAGFLAHKLAGMLGVNAALGRAKIPLLRV